MPYFPQTTPNIQRPTPEQVLWRIGQVNEVAAAVARAKAASFCPGGSGWNGNRWVTTGDGGGAMNSSGDSYQGGGGPGLYDNNNGMGPGGLTQDQLDDISNAPTVLSQHNEPCPVEQNVDCIAPGISEPPWGNQWGSTPAQTCAVGIVDQTIQQAQGLPWWVVLLIAAGGAMMVSEVLD